MKKLLFLPLAALALVPACSRDAAPPAAGSAPAPAPAAPVVAKQAAPVSITTAQVTESPMPRYLSFTGELKGSRQAMLAPDVAGKVVAAPIERGSLVKEGDVILQLDDRSAKLALQEAEASVADAQLKVDWARSELSRNQTLLKPGAISALDYERLKLNGATTQSMLTAATARRDSAQKALNDTVLRAPFSGMIVERLAEAGEYVTTSTGVALLVATHELRLIIQVPETEVGQVREGQVASFKVPAFPQATFTGTVKHLGGALRESTRDLAVEAAVANPDGQLRPGMFCEGRLVLAEERSLALPAPAVRMDGTTAKVFVVRDGAVEERIVEVGETNNGLVEIREGVAAGEVVVLAPGAEATDGMKVTLASQP